MLRSASEGNSRQAACEINGTLGAKHGRHTHPHPRAHQTDGARCVAVSLQSGELVEGLAGLSHSCRLAIICAKM